MSSIGFKSGLAGAIGGFSDGLNSGVQTASNLIRLRNDKLASEREAAAAERREGLSLRMDKARLANVEEDTAAKRQTRERQAADDKAERWGSAAEADLYSQVHEWRRSLPEKERMEHSAGIAKMGEIELSMGEGFRGAALVISSGSLDAMNGASPEAVQTTKKILSDAFGVDVGTIDGIEKTKDGGIVVYAGGKIVGKMDRNMAINSASGLMRRAKVYYSSGMSSIAEAKKAVGSPEVLDMGGGRRGVLQDGEEGGPSLREIPQFDASGKPITTGLSGAQPEAPAAEAQPEFAFEFAKQVAADGTKGPKLPVTIGGKKKTLDISEIMAGSDKDPAMNDAAEEYVHSYVRDVYSRAKKALVKKSADGTYSEKELGSLMRKHMRQEGFSKLEPYVAANYRDILGIE